MPLLRELTGTLDFDCPVRDIRQGVFHTAVLARRCGLAASLPRDALRQEPPLVSEPGLLLEKMPRSLPHWHFRAASSRRPSAWLPSMPCYR